MRKHDAACPCCAPGRPTLGRRRLLGTGVLSLVALATGAPARVLAAGKADALMISCMDYRLADNVHKAMDSLGMTDKYDHVVLAGASAGVVDDTFKGWHDTFWSHLDVAIDLHGIHSVIVVDHRDCGAYKIAFGPEHAADPDAEMAQHREVVALLAAQLKERKPELAFAAYLMALDGSIEPIELA
jgi:carbonic anhydrase